MNIGPHARSAIRRTVPQASMECTRCGTKVENPGLCSDCETEILHQTRGVQSQQTRAYTIRWVLTGVMIACWLVAISVTMAIVKGESAAVYLGGLAITGLAVGVYGLFAWGFGASPDEMRAWEETPWWGRTDRPTTPEVGFKMVAIGLPTGIFACIGAVLMSL